MAILRYYVANEYTVYLHLEEDIMADYPKMYAILCAAASDAVDLIEREHAPDRAALLLREALLKAEELYIEGGEAHDDSQPLSVTP